MAKKHLVAIRWFLMVIENGPNPLITTKIITSHLMATKFIRYH
jgi:hypothetical protein